MELMDAQYCGHFGNEVDYLLERARTLTTPEEIVTLLLNRRDHWRQQQALAEEQETK